MNLDVAGAGLGDLATRRPIDLAFSAFWRNVSTPWRGSVVSLERRDSEGQECRTDAWRWDGCLDQGWKLASAPAFLTFLSVV